MARTKQTARQVTGGKSYGEAPKPVEQATGAIPRFVNSVLNHEGKPKINSALKNAWRRYDEAAVYWVLELLTALQPDWESNDDDENPRCYLESSGMEIKVHKEEEGHWSAVARRDSSTDSGWSADLEDVSVYDSFYGNNAPSTVQVAFPRGDSTKLTQFEPNEFDTWVEHVSDETSGASYYDNPRNKFTLGHIDELTLKTSGATILSLDNVKTLEDFAREASRENERHAFTAKPTLEGLISHLFYNLRGKEPFTPAQPERVAEMFCSLAVLAGPTKIKQLLKSVDNTLWCHKKKHAYLGALFKSLTAPVRLALWSVGAGEGLGEEEFSAELKKCSAELDAQNAARLHFSHIVSERKRLATDSDTAESGSPQKRGRTADEEEA